MSFPLFLMLAAIILKLGRIADRVDPQPSYPSEGPSWPTWKRIKDSKGFWQIVWLAGVLTVFTLWPLYLFHLLFA